MEAQTEKLQVSEEELKVQQEELMQTNRELEERSKLLEEKNELIGHRNREIRKKRKSWHRVQNINPSFLRICPTSFVRPEFNSVTIQTDGGK
jgi:uncharacterized protein (DUF3084 family)